MTRQISTPAAFRRNAERVLRSAHPGATIGIVWNHCARVVWHDGTAGFSGTLTVTAPGYRTRGMVATLSHGEIGIR